MVGTDNGAATATTPTGVTGTTGYLQRTRTGDGDPTPQTTTDVGEITLTVGPRRTPPTDGGSKLTGYEIQMLDISTRTGLLRPPWRLTW